MLGKTCRFFLFQFHPEMGSTIFLFWLLFQCNMKVRSYFQLSGLWNTYLTYQIRCTTTYLYVDIPSICSGDWGRLPLTGAFTLMETRKPTVRCLITRPGYPLWEHWSLSECPAFKNMQILDQTSFKIFHLHVNNQTPWKILQMRPHASTGFWYAMFVYIWSSQLSKIT